MVYNYYRPVHPVVTGILLVCFVYVFPALTFWPHLLPDVSGGSLHGLLVRYQTLLRGCFFLLILVHLTEAVFAMMICTYMDLGKNVTLRWGISVFVNGVFALRYLISRLFDYENEQQHQASVFAASSSSYDSNWSPFYKRKRSPYNFRRHSIKFDNS